MITREEKVKEAIRRMEVLGYFEPSIEEFRKYGKIMINEPPYGAHYYVDEDKELVRKIEDLEANDNAVVYAVVRSWTNVGQLDSILYVDDWKDDWITFYKDAQDGITYTCTINRDAPEIVDFGSIRFKRTIAAGIMRAF